MSAYVDYAFYTTTYGGTAISSTEFATYANRASAYIDYVTMDRAAAIMDLEDPTPEEAALISRIKNAVCAVAEQMQYYEKAGRGVISQESVGSHSVTYAVADRKVYTAAVVNAAKLYLGHTGLMFIGFNADEYGNDVIFSWD